MTTVIAVYPKEQRVPYAHALLRTEHSCTILNMRSVKHPATRDLTARARIRDAAIECVIHEGHDPSVRSIARRAGVSGGLIEYHYGSKAALLEECDAFVTDQMADMKQKRLADAADGPTAHLLQTLSDPEYAWVVGYVIRAFQDGGPRARAMYERIVDDSRQQFEQSEQLGLVNPSRDPEARARWTTSLSIGSLMVIAALHPEKSPSEIFQYFIDEFLLPALELFTEPTLADSSYLDLYLQAMKIPEETS